MKSYIIRLIVGVCFFIYSVGMIVGHYTDLFNLYSINIVIHLVLILTSSFCVVANAVVIKKIKNDKRIEMENCITEVADSLDRPSDEGLYRRE